MLEFEDGLAHAGIAGGELAYLFIIDIIDDPVAAVFVDEGEGTAVERCLQALVAAGAAGEAVNGAVGKRGRSAKVTDLGAPEVAVHLRGMLREYAQLLRAFLGQEHGLCAVGAIPAGVMHY